jgi:Sugar (and other) transporter
VALTLQQVSDRLDRLPTSGFHARVLTVAAASLLFDTLDGIVTGFVLADRIGRKKTILYTLVLYSLFSASRGFTNDVTSFAALNFLTCMFIGAESSTVPPYLAELWPARVRGKLNGWMMGFFGAGIALAPVRAPTDVGRARRVVRTSDLLGRAYRPLTLMLWAAWFAEYGVLYAFQTFVPTILAAEGFSIVKSYGYSIVIFFGVIPAYVIGGRVVESIDRAVPLLLTFGFLIETRGTAMLFMVCDAILAVAAILVLWIGPSTRGQTLEATSRGFTSHSLNPGGAR